MEFKAVVNLNLDSVVEYIKHLPSADFQDFISKIRFRYYAENRTIINPFLEAAYNNLDFEGRYRMHNTQFHFDVYVGHCGQLYTLDGAYKEGNNQWNVCVYIEKSSPLYDKVDHVIRYGTQDESISRVLDTVEGVEFDYYTTSGYIKLLARNYATDKQTRTFDTLPYYVLNYARDLYEDILATCVKEYKCLINERFTQQ